MTVQSYQTVFRHLSHIHTLTDTKAINLYLHKITYKNGLHGQVFAAYKAGLEPEPPVGSSSSSSVSRPAAKSVGRSNFVSHSFGGSSVSFDSSTANGGLEPEPPPVSKSSCRPAAKSARRANLVSPPLHGAVASSSSSSAPLRTTGDTAA